MTEVSCWGLIHRSNYYSQVRSVSSLLLLLGGGRFFRGMVPGAYSAWKVSVP